MKIFQLEDIEVQAECSWLHELDSWQVPPVLISNETQFDRASHRALHVAVVSELNMPSSLVPEQP